MDPRSAVFGHVAEAYERGRPGYPVELAELVGARPGVEVLDLAAGTGKLTRLLVAAGATVTAVEPLDELRALIGDGATALAGTAEAIPLPDASVDVVTVAEAWHWFAGPRAAGELARVLRPGGTVALVWQTPDPDDTPAWLRGMAEIVMRHHDDHPAFGPGEQGRPALEAHPAFEPLERHRLRHVAETDRDGVLAGVTSVSSIAAMGPEERAAVLDEVAAILPDGPLRQPLVCDAWLSRRRA